MYQVFMFEQKIILADKGAENKNRRQEKWTKKEKMT